jgi:hypothetical protein
VDRQRVRWDSTLGDIFPEWRDAMANGVADIRIHHLITHRSGMGNDVIPWEGSPETNAPDLSLSQRRQRFIALAVTRPLSFPPGSNRQYSNQGYNTLGAVAEKVTGKPYETLMQEEICRPLGIRDLVFGEPALAQTHSDPWPHLKQNGRWEAVPPVPANFYGYWACNPAGGITLTLEDFGRWMIAQLNGEKRDGILQAQTLRRLHTSEAKGGIPAYTVSEQWPVQGRMLSHNGSNGRNYADHMLLPDAGVGVFVAMNAAPKQPDHASWASATTVLSQGLSGRWPAPALSPPLIPESGVVEGEALEIAQMTGGAVDFQNFNHLSGGFQLFWFGAHDNDQLTLRARIRKAGRYRLKGNFAVNRDFGEATIHMGSLECRLDFHADQLGWRVLDLGSVSLSSGPLEIQVLAHRSSGVDGVFCHLALDALAFEWLGAV